MSYLKQYEYVIAVAKHGGISQAAEKLGISQPTFSKYLKKLEGDLGVRLFDRSTLPIRLTRAGKCFANAGARFLDLDRQLAKELDEIKNDISSTVRIGISPSRSPYAIPEILASFREISPDTQIVIVEETTAEINKMLTEGELDIILSIDGDGTESFERIELFTEEILLAVPADSEASSAEDAIRTLPLITAGHGQAMWRLLMSVAGELGISRPAIECQSIESALALVKRGIGATAVPSYVRRDRSDSFRLFTIPRGVAESYTRKVCLFYRKEQFLSRAERELIECIVKLEEKDK